MDGALNKLGQDEQRLRELSNSIRQETITEELEVIMLSVADPKTPSIPQDQTVTREGPPISV